MFKFFLRPGKVHNYKQKTRGWGHDYTFEPDEKVKAKISGWGFNIKKGDFMLIEPANHPHVRYKIKSIDYCKNPSDMWFAEAEFYQRTDAERLWDNDL